MKKLALLLVLSGIMLAGPTSAMAEDHSHGMTIFGRLEPTKSGCTVLMSKYVLNLNHDDTSLPNQGTQANTSSADDHIYIQLGGENCDADQGYSKIGLKFLGTTDDAQKISLGNISTASDAAKGIGVQLSDMFGQFIIPNLTVAHFFGSNHDAQPTNQPASFPLFFTLVHLRDQATTPGKVQTNMTVQIERL